MLAVTDIDEDAEDDAEEETLSLSVVDAEVDAEVDTVLVWVVDGEVISQGNSRVSVRFSFAATAATIISFIVATWLSHVAEFCSSTGFPTLLCKRYRKEPVDV